ncbi:MazG-like family protein [Clostridium algidicarnis]|uniref:MazG-like nucleotide pyrophosphohydrolase family protein n=2 Tax=Clostridium algidicarnis TaxID=37659 RepID=A0A2S6FVR8_9CLOT|nr:MazG-like family protein [Clostridium algidicarnis]MBB6629930.1 MazG-like family protein [Clostridium algidicarnis]MBB6697055.1 MazG-like family protein [Clostridium algidicarnis]MBU3194775.1 MazG-like family protein [Clostridium algidicarnis]MBU3197292.1 MazG-like family protein [Clostridium algidicarnis]MBU3204760.1 MazG-like family protein [Clostridium algidicarnis]
MKQDNFNIMSDIKIIEGLKSQLLSVIAEFFKLLTKGSNVAQEAILECISGAIIILYVLAERLGYSYTAVDETMKKKLKIGIIEEDVVEKDGKNLSKLNSHLRER